MPSPESSGRVHQEDHQPQRYYQAASFSGEAPAGRAYFQAQEVIFNDEGCDLSVYRLLLRRVWHIAVLGEQPRPDLEQRLRVILSQGQLTSLPEQVLQELQRRRAHATKLGPWVERHFRP